MLKKNNFFFKRLISFKKNNALILESGKKSINIGVASWYPLERSIQLLDRKDRKKIKEEGRSSADRVSSPTGFPSGPPFPGSQAHIGNSQRQP